MCRMHREAKQTETSELGAEKDLLQGPNKKNGQLVFKRPKTTWFSGKNFKGNIWAAEGMTFF